MLQHQPHQCSVVEHVAQQKDPMKRIRQKGGARDNLAPRGIAVLYGPNDRVLLHRFGLPELEDDEFIAYTPRDAEEANLLRNVVHID